MVRIRKNISTPGVDHARIKIAAPRCQAFRGLDSRSVTQQPGCHLSFSLKSNMRGNNKLLFMLRFDALSGKHATDSGHTEKNTAITITITGRLTDYVKTVGLVIQMRFGGVHLNSDSCPNIMKSND